MNENSRKIIKKLEAEIEHLDDQIQVLLRENEMQKTEIARLTHIIDHLGNERNDLKAEIERLQKENENLKRWKALDKPLTAAMGIAQAEIERLKKHISVLPEVAYTRGLEAEIERLNRSPKRRTCDDQTTYSRP